MAAETFSGYGGVRLSATRYGNPDDPGVLMLHGGSDSRHVWCDAAIALAEAGRHVITIDLRGHGESEWADERKYDLDAYVGDLRMVLAELGSRPVVIAAALGGWIATAALGEDGAHLATGLVLVNAPPGVDPARAEQVSAAIRRRIDTSPEDRSGWDPHFLDGIDLATIGERLGKAAAGITVPTLVVRGDRIARHGPDATSELVDAIPDVEFVEVTDAGMLIASEQREVFNTLLVDFLERRIPARAPEFRAGSDPRTLRDALGCFATGVTVVTTIDGNGRPLGLTANSFTSVSLDPPLLLVCLAANAGSLPAFLESERIAVNVLHIGQQPVSARFASRIEDRFAQTAWERWEDGAPIIRSSLASFDCLREAAYPAGDHVILVGRVRHVKFEPRRDPLLFFRGKYRRLHFN